MKQKLSIVLLVLALTPACIFGSRIPAGQRMVIVAVIENNDVEVRLSAQGDYAPAEAGQALPVGGQVRSGTVGQARLDLEPDASLIWIGTQSELTLEALGDRSARLGLVSGVVWVALNGGTLEVVTEAGTASMRSGRMGVEYDPLTRSMEVTCQAGRCSLSNGEGQVSLRAGDTSEISGQDQGPAAEVPVSTLQQATWEALDTRIAQVTAVVLASPTFLSGLPTPILTLRPSATIQPSSTPLGDTPGISLVIINNCDRGETYTFTSTSSGAVYQYHVGPGERLSETLPKGAYLARSWTDGFLPENCDTFTTPDVIEAITETLTIEECYHRTPNP